MVVWWFHFDPQPSGGSDLDLNQTKETKGGTNRQWVMSFPDPQPQVTLTLWFGLVAWDLESQVPARKREREREREKKEKENTMKNTP